MPVIPVPGRLRQEDFCEFKTSPGYIVRPGFKNKDKTLLFVSCGHTLLNLYCVQTILGVEEMVAIRYVFL